MIRILSWIPFVYPTRIHGLLLPPYYLYLERMGRWRSPSLSNLSTVFPEKCASAQFYGRDCLAFENRDLPNRFMGDDYFMGKPDAEYFPGDFRPDKAILIGDLGIDRPFALDYRNNLYEPNVVYLRETEHGARWVEVAESFEALATALDL